MDTSFLPALCALAAAFCWGSGDFTGGLSSRRSDAFRSVMFAYSIGLVALVIIALAFAEPLPALAELGWGALAGLLGMVGVGFLFRGFAAGRMGIVAPVSAVLAAAIPVIFNAITHGAPGASQLVGFAVALVAIWLISRPEKLSGRPAGLGDAVIAGLGFAGFFIALDQVSAGTTFWPLAAGRIAACGVMFLFVLVTRRPLGLRELPWRLLILAGILDVAGNLFFLWATQTGRLDVTAVLGSLYPAVTAVLARIVIKEHMARLQMAGVVLAVLAIVLITIDPEVITGLF